jgi:hypothetical protein
MHAAYGACSCFMPVFSLMLLTCTGRRTLCSSLWMSWREPYSTSTHTVTQSFNLPVASSLDQSVVAEPCLLKLMKSGSCARTLHCTIHAAASGSASSSSASVESPLSVSWSAMMFVVVPLECPRLCQHWLWVDTPVPVMLVPCPQHVRGTSSVRRRFQGRCLRRAASSNVQISRKSTCALAA